MEKSPLVVGTLFAALAALSFGVTTPFLQRLGVGAGAFPTAALLYAGAALGALPLPGSRHKQREAQLARHHLPRLFLVALFGAALAPSLFAWGLQRVSATYGALLLNGEAVFTVLLAAALHREHVGRRIALAVGLLFAGGVLVVAGASSASTFGLVGALAVLAAVFSWALDNVLTRPFADLDPSAVVRAKALCGAALTSGLALALGQRWPGGLAALGLLACGATGYGLSLRFYLLAQRRIGAGRTGSVFALAPFVGALCAVALGERPGGAVTVLAAGLFLTGLVLHLTERHEHHHEHAALSHEHAHTHDDGHHQHPHDAYPEGPHSHAHHHEAMQHAHPHGPDAHHQHEHR